MIKKMTACPKSRPENEIKETLGSSKINEKSEIFDKNYKQMKFKETGIFNFMMNFFI